MMRIILPLAQILLVLAAATAAPADPLPGVRFDLMAVGCRIHGSSNGVTEIDEYIGRKGTSYIVKTYRGDGNLVRTTTYNANGFMTRKDWAGGKWETFSPFSCFSRSGPCVYEYRNADGARKKYVGKVSGKGRQRVSNGGFVGEAPFAPSKITLSTYNTNARVTEAGFTYRETKLENCVPSG